MAECDHCGATFDDETAYLRHLEADHGDALGPIERRRVEEALDGQGESGVPTGPLVLSVVLLVAVGVVVYVVLFLGTGASGLRHAHGTMNVTVLGDRVDFSQPRYQVQASFFHFEEANGRIWHRHARGVTLAEAMETLEIGVSETSVTIDGTTYRDGSEAYAVDVLVDGEPVDPATYELQGRPEGSAEAGEHVKIVVRRA